MGDEWYKPLILDKAWSAAMQVARKQPGANKRTALPTLSQFREEAIVAWGNFFNAEVYAFWQGIHALFTDWDGTPEDEDRAFDDRGQPMTFYDDQFIDRLCELAAEYGVYETAKLARLYMSLWDRKLERGYWVLETLKEMLLEQPEFPSEKVNAYYDYRIDLPVQIDPTKPQMQLGLFG